MEARGEKREKT